MITIGIAAILAGLATPSFKDLIQRNRLTTVSNNLLTALNYTRSEAVKRNLQVGVCHAIANSNTCGGTGSSWTTGALVYSLPRGSAANTVYNSGTTDHELLRQFSIDSPSSYTTTPTPVQNAITFTGRGLKASAGLNIKICDDDLAGTDMGRTLSVNTTGKVRISPVTCP